MMSAETCFTGLSPPGFFAPNSKIVFHVLGVEWDTFNGVPGVSAWDATLCAGSTDSIKSRTGGPKTITRKHAARPNPAGMSVHFIQLRDGFSLSSPSSMLNGSGSTFFLAWKGSSWLIGRGLPAAWSIAIGARVILCGLISNVRSWLSCTGERFSTAGAISLASISTLSTTGTRLSAAG